MTEIETSCERKIPGKSRECFGNSSFPRLLMRVSLRSNCLRMQPSLSIHLPVTSARRGNKVKEIKRDGLSHYREREEVLMNLWIPGMAWGRHYWHSAASNICPTLTPVATKGTTIMRMTDEDLLQHDNCISTMTPSLIEPLRGEEGSLILSLFPYPFLRIKSLNDEAPPIKSAFSAV